MNKLTTKLIALLATALLSLGAQATVVFDTGAPVAGASGNETTQWIQASMFNIAAGGNVAGGGVYIATNTANGDPVGIWDGVFEYWIFDNNGGIPGNVLASGNAQNVQTSDTGVAWCCNGNAHLFEFDLQSAFNAAAGVDYFLGIHLSSDYNRDDLYWVDAGPGTGGAESDGGTQDNWVRMDLKAFYLNGDARDVPEPTALALLGLGLAGMGAARRRK